MSELAQDNLLRCYLQMDIDTSQKLFTLVEVEVEQSLTPHPTQYRSFRRRWANDSVKNDKINVHCHSFASFAMLLINYCNDHVHCNSQILLVYPVEDLVADLVWDFVSAKNVATDQITVM